MRRGCLHPTQWARNKQYLLLMMRRNYGLHPTRWAWNLSQRVSLCKRKWCHHPTQWAWNNSFPEKYLKIALKSPSHTVGLERISAATRYSSPGRVSIPNGGLGTVVYLPPKCLPPTSLHPTQWAWNTNTLAYELNLAMSPSHAVGSELEDPPKKRGLQNCVRGGVTIPHGGLKTWFASNLRLGEALSPSHTVGLEPISSVGC